MSLLFDQLISTTRALIQRIIMSQSLCWSRDAGIKQTARAVKLQQFVEKIKNKQPMKSTITALNRVPQEYRLGTGDLMLGKTSWKEILKVGFEG